MALLSLQNISVSFDKTSLLDSVNLQIERGERVCLLGRNGAGKSTLLKIAAQEFAPDDGLVVLSNGAKVSRLPQEVPQGATGNVFQIVAGDSGAPDYEIEATISRLGLDGSTDFASLSGGLKRRAWLGRVLVGKPDVLLLDEPTNHLDIDSILWLEEFLVRHVQTLLFITHDRAFTRRLSTRIVEVDRGQLLSWECDYNTYLVRKEAALEAEAKQSALFDKRLKEEEAWIRRGVEARRTKSQSRIRALFQMREERAERRSRAGNAKIETQQAQKSGRLVVEANDVWFGFVDDKPIVRDFSTLVVRGDKIGVIGRNGTGKTTLLRLLLGQLPPQRGEIKLGTNLQIAYFDQLRAQLDEEQSVQWNVCGENSTVQINGEARHIVGYLSDFLFSSERARTPVKFLSGGERNRLLLAKLFTQPANVLVMDEPTNDLDAETLDVLENLLVEFKGTLLVVSHDRDFLNNVVSACLVFEDDGAGGFELREYGGGYDDYLRARKVPADEKASTKPQLSSTKPASSTKPKLSFKQARELEALPAKLEELEAEQTRLSLELSDPNFYQTQAANAAKVAARLKQIEGEMAASFARWEELLTLEAERDPARGV